MQNLRTVITVSFFILLFTAGSADDLFAQEKRQGFIKRIRYRRELRRELKGEIQLSGAFCLISYRSEMGGGVPQDTSEGCGSIFLPEVPGKALPMLWRRWSIWVWCRVKSIRRKSARELSRSR